MQWKRKHLYTADGNYKLVIATLGIRTEVLQNLKNKLAHDSTTSLWFLV